MGRGVFAGGERIVAGGFQKTPGDGLCQPRKRRELHGGHMWRRSYENGRYYHRNQCFLKIH